MVKCPQRVKTFNLCLIALLPIHPPEIDTLFLILVVKESEITLDKLFIGHIKFNSFFSFGVNSHITCEILVHIFKMSNTCRRMKIQGNFKVHIVQFIEELLIIREQIGVPAISRPAGNHIASADISDRVFGLFKFRSLFSELISNLNPMPVHIDSRNRNGNILVTEAFHKCKIFILSICLISAPPVTENKSGNKRSHTRKTVIICNCLIIIIAVSKAINILAVSFSAENLFTRFNRTVGKKKQSFAVINGCDTVFRKNTVTDFYLSCGKIERSSCAFKIS